ncbi:MAG: RNA helicase [Chloroflexi bacterium HGW-Chloroflexi-8]|nr:MAG: RNA helicase [Chloroflexi bacterium HGW-Chloroflexi-8]
MSFKTFSFHPQIQAGINAVGYENPTAIQEQTIPAIMEGSDILGLAQTGTGKTAAFVLPMLERLMSGQRGKLRALIISPTRELAEQTNKAIRELARKTGLRSMSIYGGISQQLQVRGLRGGTEIVVACPGRLMDLMDQKIVSLQNIEVLVLDEADQMFDMGFLPTIKKIVRQIPENRQTLLFSATMPEEIRSLANEFLKNPITVDIEASKPLKTISHAIYPIEQLQKTKMLLALLDKKDDGQVLIFTRTKHRAKKLADQLDKAGNSVTSLQGDLSQIQRDRAMDRFRSGHARIMVATDIAARGIDVSKISKVINYDMPNTADAYTHRIGRTGRMEHTGMALSLVTSEDLPMIRTIERLLGKSLERKELVGFEQYSNELDHASPSPIKKSNNGNRYRKYPANRQQKSFSPAR